MTACDLDDPVEIGVFATIEDALHDIDHWMTPVTAGRFGTARVP